MAGPKTVEKRPGEPPARAEPRSGGEIPPLTMAQSWGYQLQGLNLKRAEQSPFDLLVIDYSKDGTEKQALKPAEVERLKRKPDGRRRLVIAYLSIGEAESYRRYWQPDWKRTPPEWLLDENPEWEANYAVCFWHPEWQQHFCGGPDAYLDRIIAQGFDGIYLDKCDVVDDLREQHPEVARKRPRMDDDMEAFVRRLSEYAKAKRPGFRIIMQNAESLLDRPALRSAIDGMGKEELLFGLDRPEKPNTRDEIAWCRERLDLMHKAGKPVFAVEYLDSPAKIAEAAETMRKLGYVLYVADKDRELASLRYNVHEA